MVERDSKVEKWLRWIHGPITQDMIALHQQRDAFQTVMCLAQEAKLPDSYLWTYLGRTYWTTQRVPVRRQAEASEGVHTLGRLIAEVHRDAHGSPATGGSALERAHRPHRAPGGPPPV